MSYLGSSSSIPSAQLTEMGLSQQARLVHQTVLQKTYHDLLYKNPTEINKIAATLKQQVANLPENQKQLFYEIQQRFAGADPRTPPGLGQAGAVASAASTSSSVMRTISTIATITATLASIGVAVYQIRQDQKDKKAAAQQQAAEQRAYAQQTQQIQAQNQAAASSSSSKAPLALGAAAIGAAFLLTR